MSQGKRASLGDKKGTYLTGLCSRHLSIYLTAAYQRTNKKSTTASSAASGSDPTAVGGDGLLLDIEVEEFTPTETFDLAADIKKFFHDAAPHIGKSGKSKPHRKCKSCMYVFHFICCLICSAESQGIVSLWRTHPLCVDTLPVHMQSVYSFRLVYCFIEVLPAGVLQMV